MSRRGAWGSGVGLMLLFVGGMLLWRSVLRRSSLGQVDPVSATIGCVTLAFSVITFLWTIRTERNAEPDIAAVTARLALQVRNAESTARAQLLGGGELTTTIDIGFVLRPTRHEASGAARKGTLTEILDYYRKLTPKRLVITGARGSGKTVTAIELMLGLLTEVDPTHRNPLRMSATPVPIRMSATSLDPSLSVPEWMTEHLRKHYRLSERAALALVQSRAVLPVIDGLDERSEDDKPGYSSSAAQLLRSCNAYLEGTAKGALILTCRDEQYASLIDAGERLTDAAHVELKAVGLTDAKKFIDGRVEDKKGRWEPVLSALRRGGNKELATALSTPWRLSLATVAYERRSPAGEYLREPAELVAPELDTEAKIGEHLLDLYITGAVGKFGEECQSRLWLTTLANYMHEKQATDFWLDDMWDIGGSFLPRLAALAPMYILCGLLVIIGDGQLRVLGPVPALLTSLQIFGRRSWPQPFQVRFSRVRAALHDPTARTNFGRWATVSVLTTVAIKALGGPTFTNYTAFAFCTLLVVMAAVLALAIVDVSEAKGAEPADRVRFGLALALGIIAVVCGVTLAATTILSDGAFRFGILFETPTLLAELVTLTILFAAATMLVFTTPRSAMYLGMLMCTRSWTRNPLPWRLDRFLSRCSEAGLMRTAGTCYQFRHKEIQDYLAALDQPQPVTA